jgi:hypothetical protein
MNHTAPSGPVVIAPKLIFCTGAVYWVNSPAVVIRPIVFIQSLSLDKVNHNPHMKSDAYATGVALTSLAESKALTAHDGAFQRGINYLLSTRFPDGSWYVRSRSIKFQPYFESGFPFGHDQWISAAATAWAAQAIAMGLEPASNTPSSAQKRR